MNILSLQSWVASGHVGNAAVMFPLQRLGAEVSAVHTVQFSNHPGHGAYTGQVFAAADIGALVAGLDAHGALNRCDGVLSGYIGDPAIGAVVLDAVARVRAHHPLALWCCDPVMGDAGKLYVRDGIAEFFAREAIHAADILTPNQFELDLLTGLPSTTLAKAKIAAHALRDRMHAAGPRLVLVSSIQTEETPPGCIDMLLVGAQGGVRARTPLLPAHFSGAGDLLAALFLFHVLASGDAADAAVRAAQSLAGVLWQTWQSGQGELQIVAAQGEFITPTRVIAFESC